MTTQTGIVDIDYNLHWRADGAPNIRWGTTYPTWAQWQAMGYDLHGVNGDPLLVSASTSDFTLQSTSPCINAGANVGLIKDFAGISVPQGSSPDIGAYEYVGAAPTDTTPPASPSGVSVQ